MGLQAPVSLRVNPDLDPGTHPHISTGHRDSKFGIPLSQVDEYYAEARSPAESRTGGPRAPISARRSPRPRRLRGRLRKSRRSSRDLRADGIALKYLDLGGGLGIPYQEEPPPPAQYAAALIGPLRDIGLKIIIEPGRVLVGNAGILVTKVLYVKETDVKRFIVVDGAMNDLIRPVLYEAYHEIVPVMRRDGTDRRPPTSSARCARAAISLRVSANCPRSIRATCSR